MRYLLALAVLTALMVIGPTWGSPTPSEEERLIRFNLEGGRFPERREFYLTDGKLITIDKTLGEGVTAEKPETLFPNISIKDAKKAELQEFLEDIREMGLFQWERRYSHPAEDDPGFLCHFGWSVIVVTSHQVVFSEGYCAGPGNVEELIRRTKRLFQ